MDINYDLIGMKIKHFRMKKGLSQEELGEIINTSNRHLSNVETGMKTPSLTLIIDIANALDITADDLLTDYLTNSKVIPTTELIDIITDCSDTRRAILIGMLKNLNALLSEYGI